MSWLTSTLTDHTAIQALMVISLICGLGLALAKIRIRGISLGSAYVFFAGIFLGCLGVTVDASMLKYAESFGLVLFVYMVGLQVGPGFITSFRKGGMKLNSLAVAVVILGTLMAVAVPLAGILPMGDAMGVLSGATTNTPALGAAQQTLAQVGQSATGAALACALTYPIGLIGVIFVLMLMRPWLTRHERTEATDTEEESAYICSFWIRNPAIFGKTVGEISDMGLKDSVISRIWRGTGVILARGDSTLNEGDRILVITQKASVKKLTFLFGALDHTNWNSADINWNTIDSRIISQRILITRPELNGKKLGDLHLRMRYGVSISRLQRAGMQLVATPGLLLRMGDRLTVVGDKAAIDSVTQLLGNAIKQLDEPNIVVIFFGIVLGLLLGAIPLAIPGMSTPVQLGLAGGPIIMGILMGAYGPRLHMLTYTTTSVNLMLKSLGISIYLACLGLDAGRDFIATVMRPDSLLWALVAILITAVPVAVVAVVGVVGTHRCYETVAGMLCGAMANPIALGFVNDTTDNDKASVAYASVYPLCMFLRVIIAQLVIMLWFQA